MEVGVYVGTPTGMCGGGCIYVGTYTQVCVEVGVYVGMCGGR